MCCEKADCLGYLQFAGLTKPAGERPQYFNLALAQNSFKERRFHEPIFRIKYQWKVFFDN
jgi:hypothetical protein